MAKHSATRCKQWIGALLTLLVLLMAAPLHAASTIILGTDFTQTELSEYLDILEGNAAAVTAPEAVARQFRPFNSSDLARAAHPQWLRFGLVNATTKDATLILQLQPEAPAAADFRVQSNSALTLRPVQLAGLAREGGLYEVRVPAQARGLIYLRLRSDALRGNTLKLASLEHHMRINSQQGWLRGLGQGLLLMLLVVSLLCAAITRDRIYLWFAAATLFHLLPSSLYWLGESSLYFHAPASDSQWLASSWLLAAAAILQLTIRYPAWPKNSQRWPLVLHAMTLVVVIAAIALTVKPEWTSLGLLSALILPTIVLTTLSAMQAYFVQQERLLLGFALARFWMFLAAASIATYPRETSNLPYSFYSLLLIGSGVEMLLLLLLLAQRTLNQLHQTAAQQRAIAAAEAESRARTELTAAMAHRIRTPVSGVLGMIEMLQDAALSAAQREQLDTMQRAGNELLNAVNELSDFSRLEFSADPLQRGSFDMQALIVESVEGFRGLASTRALELITDFAPNLPRYVSGDQTRVRQLLLQLLHHAIAQFRDGEILLRVDGQDRHLQFALTVHGSAAASTGTEGDALLRLAIARQLTTTLGGNIHLPEPSAHSWRASFTLPLPAIERQRSASELDQSLRHHHLLIIDDSATFREVIQRRAEHWGMYVHSAGTLSEGLARLNNQLTIGEPVDAVLLDAELPELADPESHARLRDAGLPRVVILLATLPEAEHSALASALGVRRALLKPLDHTSLQLALAEELSAPTPRRITAHSSTPLHCLIAEDNPINAQVLQGMLTKLGATFTTTVNGQAAVEAFQREAFDLVLMDCDMPVMDGFEAARRIREIQQNRLDPATPIIALTANTLEELGERARTGVMDAHLVKPVRLPSLRQLLEHWSGRMLAPADWAD